MDQEALLSYAREAADFSTQQQLPSLDFAINHYGQPDVAMFDFTCMYASENAALVREHNGHQLLVALVGDSLLEVRVGVGGGMTRNMGSQAGSQEWGTELGGYHVPFSVTTELSITGYKALGQSPLPFILQTSAQPTSHPPQGHPLLSSSQYWPVLPISPCLRFGSLKETLR